MIKSSLYCISIDNRICLPARVFCSKKRVFCYIFSFYTILRQNKLTRCIFDHCKLKRCTETQIQIHDMSSLVFFIYANSFLFIKWMPVERYLFPFHGFKIYIDWYIQVCKCGLCLTIKHCSVYTRNYFQFQMCPIHVHLKRWLARLICW